ncbi:amino acid adenylation domain-containing protein [Chitinophaga filiformis]|uniref:non-ribosomal peptide synthetase n=1 Tax=Chitinophaga filiformis TaxID=104663 RepID=UPI001F22E7E1|nr:non-ribosomal peptide synthetase [Chitinophaga filiformis]MCF6402531.1 amino acid adenylation domain-containing protein [Chitinophaga filiformis]MCF6403551.1 amino acid adenylation domain-containing protein [Chitinophaga filiformis]
MSIQRLLSRLKELEVQLRLKDDKLSITAPDGVLTADLIAEIRSNKELITRFLKNIEHAAFRKIPQVAESPYYELSPAQKRMWLLEQKGQGQLTYNMFNVYTLEGPLNKAALSGAFAALVERHESLRTLFAVVDGLPKLRIIPFSDCGFEVTWSQPEDAEAYVQAVANTPFDLLTGPLFKVHVLETGVQQFLLLLSMHHIISDEWSMQVMLQELLLLYNAFDADAMPDLSPLPVQFKDYAAWQLQHLQGDRINAHRDYWLDHLSGKLPVLQLPLDKPRADVLTHQGAQYNFTFSENTGPQLQQYVQSKGATLFMGLLALVKVLLYRYTAAEDIIIGTSVAGREHPDLEGVIGNFLNALALRTRIDGTAGFDQLLEKVKETALNGFGHEMYPFDQLVEDLGIAPAPNRHPLFDVVVIMQSEQQRQRAFPAMNGITIDTRAVDLHISKGDLRFQFAYENGVLEGGIEYNTDLFNASRIAVIAADLNRLLSSILANPMLPLQQHVYHDKTIPQGAADFDKVMAAPQYPALHVVLNDTARRFAGNIAISSGKEQLTYKALDERSRRLAQLLALLGVSPETRVGVFLPSGTRQVVSLIACLHSGGVYMPLDIQQPLTRSLQILKEQAPQVLITGMEDLEQVKAIGQQLDTRVPYLLGLPGLTSTLLEDLELDDISLIDSLAEQLQLYAYNGTDYVLSGITLPIVGEETIPAYAGTYIFFTSGSTGTPKGIKGDLQSLAHYIHWHRETYQVGSKDSISQLAPATFDASLKDILVALTSGATLCIPEPEERFQMALLVKWLAAANITILQTVPSLFRLITKELAAANSRLQSLRLIVLAGERLYGRDIQQWRAVNGNDALMVNMYGLTETTILKSYYPLTQWEGAAGDIIPVGQPIANTSIAVVRNNVLCVAGEIGDVYIKSPYVSLGYTDPALTEKLFVRNPLVNDRVEYVCRTGDVGRYREDGMLELLGRNDEQIKLHGVRVELGAVSSSILQLEGITQTELIVQQTEDGGQVLLCYYTGQQWKSENLRQELEQVLPASHLPAYYLWMDAFPLNINGKVDRRKLPQPEALLSADKYKAPLPGIEQDISLLWKRLLGIERIGREESFFVIGGSSLKAIQLISLIFKEKEVHLTIKEIFDHPTIAAQAVLVSKAQKALYETITPVQTQEYYELSHAQKRIWIAAQQQNVSLSFNGLEIYRLQGTLDKAALIAAFNALLQRHESLRTTFVLVDGSPKQRIRTVAESGFDVQYAELGAVPQEMINAIARTPYNLAEGPLLRVQLVKTGEQTHTLLFGIHHIISDEWSMQLMLRELLVYYNAYSNKHDISLSPLKIQYRDYAAWHSRQLSGTAVQTLQQYWLRTLEGPLPRLILPMDRPRPAIRTYDGAQYSFTIDTANARAFVAYLEREGVTPFMGLLALVKALLFRYTAEEDIIIGTPVAGRDHPDLEDQIGYYLNTLALRTQVSGNIDFGELLQRVKKTALSAFDHQLYPFDALVEDLGAGTDQGRNPLFDVVVVLQNIRVHDGPEAALQGLSVERERVDVKTSKGDLRFQFALDNGSLEGSIEYNTALFDEKRVANMAGDLDRLLGAVIARPGLPLKQHVYHNHLVPAAAADFDKVMPVQELPTLHTSFSAIAAQYPAKHAIETPEESITYASLEADSNRLRQALHALDIMPGHTVGVLLPAGIRLVTTLLACLKAGVVYMPLDVDQPVGRLKNILEAQAPHILIVGSEHMEKFSDIGVAVPYLLGVPSSMGSLVKGLELDDISAIAVASQELQLMQLEGGSYWPADIPAVEDSPLPVAGNNAAYIFYTSGSTGAPKGIIGRSQSLAHYIHWHREHYVVDAADRISQLAPVTFDASLKDILVALTAGATLCMPSAEDRYRPHQLGRWLSDAGITILQTVPSLFRLITKSLLQEQRNIPSLRQIVLAGEKLYGRDISQWRKINTTARIANMYGLTETTILKCYYEVPDGEHEAGSVIPAGTPISHTSVAVISNDVLCVEGEIGEVYIKSPYMTQGYTDASLTAQLFVQNPLVKDREELVCRTGDLGRFHKDGTLELLGRRDEQIKLHGVRIELAGIRSSLLRLSGITQVELILHEQEDEQTLLCYYSGQHRDSGELRQQLANELPASHLPGYYIWMESFPLNLNGKVDRKKLPRPEEIMEGEQYEAPQNGTEQQLLGIWQRLLGVSRIGRNTSFFVAGGSSLKAIQLISRIYKELDVQLTIGDAFNHPTIAAQAALLDSAKKAGYQEIRKTQESAFYPLSHAQRRLWVVCQRLCEIQPFNGLEVYYLEGDLQPEVLSKAFGLLLERHESLRTVFVLVDGEPQQGVRPVDSTGFSMIYEDLSADPAQQEKIAQRKLAIAGTPYELDKGPLLRIQLIKTGPASYTLLFGIHHIISDEWSMQIMLRELQLLYNAALKGTAAVLPPLRIQYRDYARWQLASANDSLFTAHREYWLSRLGGELPRLSLTSGRQRPAVQTYNGQHFHFSIDASLADGFRQLLNNSNCTLFMGLVTLVKTLLYRYTGQEDIIIGTPVAGREHPDLENQVGYYLNTIALRTKLSGEETFSSYLEQVKKIALEGYAHQEYPFDHLVEELGAGTDISRNPVFDVTVILQNVQVNKGQDTVMEGVTIQAELPELHISKGDLRFQFIESEGGIAGNIEYNTDLFDASRIEQMFVDLKALLTNVVADPGILLRRISYMEDTQAARLEKQQIHFMSDIDESY